MSNPFERKSGQVSPGNIDVLGRKIRRNPDGTISTLKSLGLGRVDGLEMLLPGMLSGGRDLSPAEAAERYLQSGEHLGIFNSPQAATKHAEMLHRQQDLHYSKGSERAIQPTTPQMNGSVNVPTTAFRGPAGYAGPSPDGAGLSGLFETFAPNMSIGPKAEVDPYVEPPKLDYWLAEHLKRTRPQDLPSTYSVINRGTPNWMK